MLTKLNLQQDTKAAGQSCFLRGSVSKPHPQRLRTSQSPLESLFANQISPPRFGENHFLDHLSPRPTSPESLLCIDSSSPMSALDHQPASSWERGFHLLHRNTAMSMLTSKDSSSPYPIEKPASPRCTAPLFGKLVTLESLITWARERPSGFRYARSGTSSQDNARR